MCQLCLLLSPLGSFRQTGGVLLTPPTFKRPPDLPRLVQAFLQGFLPPGLRLQSLALLPWEAGPHMASPEAASPGLRPVSLQTLPPLSACPSSGFFLSSVRALFAKRGLLQTSTAGRGAQGRGSEE